MQRIPIQPRSDWQRIVESQGFYFHSLEEVPYWDESVYYRFTRQEIDTLEQATYALNEMCLSAVQHVIDNNLFDQFQIPSSFVDFVVDSWDRDEFTLYGRFDLAYDGSSPPKLLEYNADTPTALLEAAVIQWFWMKDVFPKFDQFNSIHERLIDAWMQFRSSISSSIVFSCLSGHLEDFMTVAYLRDTAMQAQLSTQYLAIEQVGWNADRRLFVDLQEQPIEHLFKLYPWEWMLREEFGPHLLECSTRWLEAPWKMILSNKAILPILYQLFPGSPYLLKADFQPIGSSYVRKPLLAREGANVQMIREGRTLAESDGIYPGPYIYQELCLLPSFHGNYPVIGSWMVNGYACGIGIREDASPITGNTSRFVPHVFL